YGPENQDNDFEQQIQQLLQLMGGIMPQVQQNNQIRKMNTVSIPSFAGANQDSVEWLEMVSCAFEANNIQGNRRIAVIGAYLTGMAAMWWETRRNTRPHIDCWEDNFHSDVSFVHQFRQNFCTQMLVSQWNTELLTRRQRIGETIDQYAANMAALFR
ncbi:16868_t:CDS:1, partial [Racocetra fulgida]